MIETEFEYGHIDFDRELFFAYLGLSLYWGYNFAKEVISPSGNPKDKEPSSK